MWLRSRPLVESLYGLSEVYLMFKIEDDERATVTFGWQLQEEAFCYAPLILRPRDRFQLSYLVSLLKKWLLNEDNILDKEDIDALSLQYEALILLDKYMSRDSRLPFIWTKEAEASWNGIDESGGWFSSTIQKCVIL